MTIPKWLPVILTLMAPFPALAQAAGPVPSLRIAVDKVKAPMSPRLYGLMTEEINFSYEGGLYGELLRNRSFKGEGGFAYVNEDPVYWSPVGGAAIALDGKVPLNKALDLSLRIDAGTASVEKPAGISNSGYWGIPVVPRTVYTAAFFARADGSAGPVTVALRGKDGTVLASATTPALTGQWQRFEVKLTSASQAPSKDNTFSLTTSTPGKIWVQQVSLFGPTYNNRKNGTRPDLMALMAGMKPTFLRLPGGNYLEGDTFAQRFDWKKTIGPTEERPGHRSPWNYWSTDGLGLMEYLQWCEDLKVDPVLAVFAGYALGGEHVSSPEELAPYVQDALDEIEYVTGDVHTEWGAKRARDGHPAPFALTYVEIGNEDFFDHAGTYDKRFSAFYKAIKARYPNLKLISTMPADATPSQAPDLVDEHTYAWGGTEMYDHVNDYDGRSRAGPKVFVGEWATHDGWPMPNMRAALADAAYLIGLERNSDLVVMSSYAPLLANVSQVGGDSRERSMQWAVNLIGYDALKAYGTPSYYVQKMFAENKGDLVLETAGRDIPQLTDSDGKTRPSLFWGATCETSTHHLKLKLVNRRGEAQPVRIALEGVQSMAKTGWLTELSSADPGAGNDIDAPERIVPKTTAISGLSRTFTRTLAAYSVTIVDVDAACGEAQRP